MTSDERYQELYSMTNEDCGRLHIDPEDETLNSLADCLTVHRIPDNKLKALEHLLDEKEFNALKTAELDEKKNLAEDYEAIVRNQLQLLQADERGRIALEKEIEGIKSRQQKRSDALKARKKALLIEKAQAKKIASRPAPLPKSVLMMLKEQERKAEEANQNALLPPQHFIEEENDDFENDENFFNAEEMEEKKKLQEMWDKKAKIRFNEAIKKERQNKENTEILKEIQNAEKVNRRHMAKTVSAKGGNVPCQAPDNIFHSSQQVAMENKVERIFKKNPKEHAVEDLEGYEDRFEAKYREIDSNLEARLIDCVPSFVKENYNYLLEDESVLQCGRRFTGFQNEEDALNTGFIASPPSTEELERSKEVEDIINTLNKMHQETNEMIEKDFKPLLKTIGVTKVESLDKAVEANILKMPTEHKSIEVSTSDADQVPLEPLDTMSGGVMNFKRKPLHPVFEYPGSARARFLSPPRVEPDFGKTSGQESWSSSSYWSLPSKHGMPKTCNLCDSPTCKIPLVEHQKHPLTCIPLSKSKVPSGSEQSVAEEPISPGGSQQAASSPVSPEKNLSHYVRIVAEKYLKSPKDTQKELLNEENYESVTEPEVFFSTDPTDPNNSFKFGYTEEGFRESLQEENKISDFEAHSSPETKSSPPDSPSHPADATNMDASAEDSFLRKCKEAISDNLLGLFRPPAEDGGSSAKVQYSSPYHPGRVVYHELSTIQEMDSALTNDSNHTKRSLERRSVSVERSEGSANHSINTTPVSLMEDPPEEFSNLAKSIKFTEKSPLKSTAAQNEAVVHPSSNTSSPGKSSRASEVSSGSGLASKFDTLLSIQTGNVGPLTPSTVSAQASPMSVGSHGVPYAVSSPFKEQPGTLMSLPKYFQDLSSIRKGSSSSASSVAEERNQAQYSAEKQVSYGMGSFAPMSECLEPSSPLETRYHTLHQEKSNVPDWAASHRAAGQSSHFQAMTPRTGESNWYNLSTVDDTSNHQSPGVWNNEQKDTSWYNLSTEDDTSNHNSQSVGKQKASSHIPMHFDKSFETDDAASPSSGRFHFLTPHTYLPSLTASSASSKTATPSEREFNPRGVDESVAPELTNSFDFQPMRKKPSPSLKSQVINSVRSPLKSSSSSLQPNLSLSEVKSFLKQSISSDIILPTHQGVCKPVNIKLNFQTRAFRSHRESPEPKVDFAPLSDNDKENGSESSEGDNVPRSSFPPNSHETAAKVAGSEPFLPTLTARDFGVPSESLEATKDSQMKTPTLKPFTPSQVVQQNDYPNTACADEESPLSRNKVEFTERPPDFPNLPSTPLLQILKNNNLTGSSSQHNTPYRSTTLEEMMETGILNEPDLTLVNSEFTIHPGSPEKEWHPENNQSCSVPFERDFSAMNTPPRNALLDVCDSPSMMSFLQHEQSCLLASESTDERKEITQNQLQEKIKASPRSAKKRTPWNEYKSRTKRLWNNLEEVKEKKMLREKREEMLKNRKKMKEYAKKLPASKK